MKTKNKNLAVALAFIFLMIILKMNFLTAVEPSGATISGSSPQTAPSGTAGNISAFAGNITGITLFSEEGTTQSWQGFYGNVTGGLRLANADDQVIYNWSLVSPNGEVYASTNSTINWPNIQCFNFTAVGNYSNESGQGGTTNLYGKNSSRLELEFSINESDLDGVNETFAAKNHDQFFTSSKQFSSNECHSIQLFTNSSNPQDGVYEEILLYEPTTTSIVFTAILESNSTLGFDDTANDFEMIVLENGHGSNVATTTYFFFMEIQ